MIDDKTRVPFELGRDLLVDLVQRHGGKSLKIWREVYGSLPSCSHLQGNSYFLAMTDKYVKAYKLVDEMCYKESSGISAGEAQLDLFRAQEGICHSESLPDVYVHEGGIDGI